MTGRQSRSWAHALCRALLVTKLITPTGDRVGRLLRMLLAVGSCYGAGRAPEDRQKNLSRSGVGEAHFDDRAAIAKLGPCALPRIACHEINNAYGRSGWPAIEDVTGGRIMLRRRASPRRPAKKSFTERRGGGPRSCGGFKRLGSKRNGGFRHPPLRQIHLSMMQEPLVPDTAQDWLSAGLWLCLWGSSAARFLKSVGLL